MLKPSKFMDALKLRTNTFGTKVVLNRAKQIKTKCRKCSVQRETLGHILGMCIHSITAFTAKRIRRHDEIKDFITSRLSKKHPVFMEPTVFVTGELKKPDLIVKD